MARISVRFWGILVICLCWAAMAEAEYKKYKDPKQPINVRIKDLMSRMTLEEKIGQMTQIDRTVASGQVINKYLLGKLHLIFILPILLPFFLFFSFLLLKEGSLLSTTLGIAPVEGEGLCLYLGRV